MSFIFDNVNIVEQSNHRGTTILSETEFTFDRIVKSSMLKAVAGTANLTTGSNKHGIGANAVENKLGNLPMETGEYNTVRIYVTSGNMSTRNTDASADAFNGHYGTRDLTRPTSPPVEGVGTDISTVSTKHTPLNKRCWLMSSSGPCVPIFFRPSQRFFTLPRVVRYAQPGNEGGGGSGGGSGGGGGEAFSKDERLAWPTKEDSYVGEVHKNAAGVLVPHGTGRLEYKAGTLKGVVIEGTFADGLSEGKMKMTQANGVIFTANFEKNVPNGEGEYALPNGDKHEVVFKEGKIEDKVTIKFANGNRYVGDYKNGKCEGKGTLYFKDGSRYDGDFSDNSFEGKGIYTYTNLSKYIGEFVKGCPCGTGVQMDHVGKIVYSGPWKDGEPVNWKEDQPFQ